MKTRFSSRNVQLVIYALAMAIGMLLIRYLEFRLLVLSHSFELYAAIIAVLFTCLGIWIARKFTHPQTVVAEKRIPGQNASVTNISKANLAGISPRELEVLQLIAKGHSNSKIASELFVSVNTVKTHVSNILVKMEVSRRSQAVAKAVQLGFWSS